MSNKDTNMVHYMDHLEGITDEEKKLAEEVRKYAMTQYEDPKTYWDWVNETHEDVEIVEEFIRPSNCKTLEDVKKCEEIKFFFKIMGIEEDNSRW